METWQTLKRRPEEVSGSTFKENRNCRLCRKKLCWVQLEYVGSCLEVHYISICYINYGKSAVDIENAVTDRRITGARKATWLSSNGLKVTKASWYNCASVYSKKCHVEFGPRWIGKLKTWFKNDKIQKASYMWWSFWWPW